MTVQEVKDNDGAIVTIKMDSGNETGKLVKCKGSALFEHVRDEHLTKSNEALCWILNTEQKPLYFNIDKLELHND